MKKKSEKFTYILVVVLFLIFTLTPIIWLLSMSLTKDVDLLSKNTDIFPKFIYKGNYAKLLDPNSKEHEIVFSGLRNSIILAVFTLIIGLPTSILTAYAFVRYHFKARKTLLMSLLISIAIPVFTTIIPIYAIYASLGILDRLFFISIIFVSSILPANTWVIMSYFKKIPVEIWEGAEVDGCNERQLFFKIILPISKPIILTSALMIVLASWCQFQIPLILTSSQKNKVITLVLSEFITRDAISYGIIAACGIISILPPAILAIIFRKFLVNGMLQGSVKG